MGQITLTLKDETIATLRKDFDAFLRVSLKLDPQFATPSFEDFLRAKLLDNMVPLTEHAVQRMLQGGQYAWAKRTLDKEFPDVVAILMRQAGEFGFGFAARSEWTPEELAKQCRDWAAAIVKEAEGDAVLIDPLAAQIKSAAQDIQALEEVMQTPAWRLVESLRQRVYEAKVACETSVGSTAREKLGELRGLLRLRHFARLVPEAGSAADHGVPAPAQAGDFRRRAVRRVFTDGGLAAQFLRAAASGAAATAATAVALKLKTLENLYGVTGSQRRQRAAAKRRIAYQRTRPTVFTRVRCPTLTRYRCYARERAPPRLNPTSS